MSKFGTIAVRSTPSISMEMQAMLLERNVSVATLDEDVKLQLRACGEPICLFAEGPGDRRSRLMEVLLRKTFSEEDVALQREILGLKSQSSKEETKPKETVYTRASSELIAARQYIYKYSIEKCQERLARQSEEESNVEKFKAHELEIKTLWDQYSVYKIYKCEIKNLFVEASQFGADRPISCCRVNNKNPAVPSDLLLTGCFGGELRLWNLSNGNRINSWKAHESRVCSISWSPNSTLMLNQDEIVNQGSQVMFATASLDKTAKLWGYTDNHPVLLQTLTGHINRVTTVEFHPSARYCGTVSLDCSFRLWDIETGQQLLLQDGHARDVMGLDFQCDGSIAATCDQSGVCRIWDLRTGRSVSTLQGHAKGMVCCRFSPNGFQFATSSDDNTVKIWDLRKQKSLYTIPAHQSVIPDIHYDQTGEFLVTCSFDKTIRVWSTRNYQCIKTLEGHDGCVTNVDFLTNKVGVVSCSHDKTWKKWSGDVF